MQEQSLPDMGYFQLTSNYFSALRDWHLQLAVCQEALSQVMLDLECESKFSNPLGSYTAIISILRERFEFLVTSCPFPELAFQSPVDMEKLSLDDVSIS